MYLGRVRSLCTLASSATWSAAAGAALLLGLVLLAGPRVLRRAVRTR